MSQAFDLKRFGLQAGDTVKPTSEYERLFNKSFYATILFFKGEVAIIEKDNGERDMINCYWLEKVREGGGLKQK